MEEEKEKEKTLKYDQEMKEEEAHIFVNQRSVQEDNLDAILTQWVKEMKLLEDWLINLETDEDY